MLMTGENPESVIPRKLYSRESAFLKQLSHEIISIIITFSRSGRDRSWGVIAWRIKTYAPTTACMDSFLSIMDCNACCLSITNHGLALGLM